MNFVSSHDKIRPFCLIYPHNIVHDIYDYPLYYACYFPDIQFEQLSGKELDIENYISLFVIHVFKFPEEMSDGLNINFAWSCQKMR